jgi:hypothetical protein
MFHHYVPRFYLARFVDEDGYLWVFDKLSGRMFRKLPEKIGGENRFYTLTELPSGADPETLEKQLAGIECQTRNIISCWLRQVQSSTTIEIPKVNREIISRFLAIQLLRIAEARTQIVQFAELVKRDPAYSPEADARNLHIRMFWDEKLTNKIARQIKQCIWVFAKNDSDRPFFTSDHPVLIKSFDSEQWILGPRVFDPGMYVVFPLSPQWILYCKEPRHWKKVARFDKSVSPVTFTPDMVDHENSGQIGMSSRFVFASTSNFEFAREYSSLYPNIKDPQRRRFG